MNEYAVFVEGLDDVSFVDLKPQILTAATRAINRTADFSRGHSADMMRRAYNFPGNYLDPAKGRLVVSQRAKTSNLEAMLTARARATSLARFMISGQVNRMGVVIEMKKGRSATLERAFPVKLRGSKGENSNLGLAVRTKGGVRPDNAYKPSKLAEGLWLLYGISVNQAFNYTREMTSKDAAVYLEGEFLRFLDLEAI
jgi:hypothetical protein